MIRPSFAMIWYKNNIRIDFGYYCLQFLLFCDIAFTNMSVGKIQFMYI